MCVAKTPAEIARIFGCTEEQARAQIKATAEQLHAMAEKARRSAKGKYRGFTAGHLSNQAAQFDAAANKGN